MKEAFKDVCYPYQTHMNSRTCLGAITGDCIKKQSYCKNAEESRYVLVPDYVFKKWKDSGAVFKALNVVPKTPHTFEQAATSKGKDDGKGRGKDKGKGKSNDDKGKGKGEDKGRQM